MEEARADGVGGGDGSKKNGSGKRKRGGGEEGERASSADGGAAGAKAAAGGGSSMQTFVQILGTETGDTCPSVLIVAQNCRYMINVGDGIQRFCTQHGVRLVKLNHIFLTRLHADAIGGLLGMYLTLADTGVKQVVVHGPPGTSRFLSAGQAFCENRPDAKLSSEEMKLLTPDAFTDCNVSIQPYVAWPETVDDGPSQATNGGAQGQEDGRGAGEEEEMEEEEMEEEADAGKKNVRHKQPRRDSAVSYVMRFPDVPGKFDVNKAKALGIPPGPLFARLKAGQTVEVPGGDGRTVDPSECVEVGAQGACMAVIDCPSSSFVSSLSSAMSGASQPPPPKGSSNMAAAAGLSCNFMVHSAPMEVLLDKRYIDLVKAVSSPSTVHAVINAKVCPERCVYPSHAIINSHLNAMRPLLFPRASGMPGSLMGSGDVGERRELQRVRDAWGGVEGVVAGDILLRYGLTPLKWAGVDWSAVEDIDKPPTGGVVAEGVQDGHCMDGHGGDDVPANIKGIGRDVCEVVMLGTAASVPGKYRNVSGVYLDLPGRGGMLLDCGEGSLGQMSRRYGRDALEERLIGLKCVWISHMHADHHLGLLRIMSLRSAAVRASGAVATPPLTIIGPPPLSKWLKTYAAFDKVEYELIHNSRFHPGKEWVGAGPRQVLKGLLADDLEVDIVTVPVRHSCRDACAVIVTSREEVEGGGGPKWKIACSGDTRPCQALVDAGMDATLLIHEATLDTPLIEDAKLKQHSTTGEALSIGRRMRAYRTLLTHFSQRYPKVPPLDEIAQDGNAAVAFDLMSINLADVATLPSMMPGLVRLAAEQNWLE